MTKTEIIPYIFYRDVAEALEWLTRAFGFKEELRTATPSGGMHGEMSFDGQRIMMGQGAKDWGMVRPGLRRFGAGWEFVSPLRGSGYLASFIPGAHAPGY